MAVIKRLHWFMLKTFLPLFAMTFFIVLFIVLMQFLWRYIDDLVGKGLSFSVLGELFFYAALSMVPMALPLAILLASLMTFGNLGEKSELTAMKASGISLLRVMSPLIVTVGFIAVGAFFFQNDVLPKAQVKMWTLLFSARQKSPELEIPENVFYDQIPGFNLYVKEKDRDAGILKEVTIYDVSRGGDNATIITADSAILAFTPDMRYLYLHLFKGEQFENLRDQNRRNAGINTPFRREAFIDKEVLIPFDANFNRLDEGGMRSQYVGKNISELQATMDSITVRLDSIGKVETPILKQQELSGLRTLAPRNSYTPTYSKASYAASGADNPNRQWNVTLDYTGVHPIKIDTLLRNVQAQQQVEIYTNAINMVERRKDMMTFRAQVMQDEKKILRRHEIELIKKFTLSVACIIFFFIGAPLGAIIRKGGLGTPLVISVLFFLVYYIIDNTGYKMARDGKMIVWVGMWLSSFILAPLGVYITWKAMNDSAVFDKDRYLTFLRKLVGARESRSINSKEVIINDIDEPAAISMLEKLAADAEALAAKFGGKMTYRDYLMNGINPADVNALSEQLEETIAYLCDSRDPQVITKLADFPVLRKIWIYQPFRNAILSKAMMILFPIGLPLWFAGLRARKDLLADCRSITDRCCLIIPLLQK